MSQPNQSSPYYRSRPRPAESNFEEGYWGVVVDPDGVQRDMRTERQRVLEDIVGELAYINELEPGRLLDVGCGLGYLLSGVDDSWERHGVELSSFAAQHAEAYGQIHVGDLASAAYPDDHFDVVTLYHVIEHMLDPCNELLEIKRVLKPGGHFVIATPDFDSACARRFGEKFRMLNDKTHVRLFSRESMYRFLRDHGFVVDRVELPYFETRHFTRENLERLFDTTRISPAFYGNIMTFYAHLPARSAAVELLASATVASRRVVEEQAQELERFVSLLAATKLRGGTVFFRGDGAPNLMEPLARAGFSVLDPGREPAGDRQRPAPGLADLQVEAWLGEASSSVDLKRSHRIVAFVLEGSEPPAADVVIRLSTAERSVAALTQRMIVESLSMAEPQPQSVEASLLRASAASLEA